MAHFSDTLRGLSRVGAAALVCVLVLTACQTTRQMTREQGSETLELDKAWYRLADRETDGTIFRARHQDTGLELEVESLSSPVRLDAVPIWTRAWLASRYGTVEMLGISDGRVDGLPSKRFAIAVPSRSLQFEYAAVNTAGTTYLMTIWGDAASFDAWQSDIESVAGGLRLPTGLSNDSLACRDSDRSLSLEGLEFTLPAEPTDGPQLCDVWNAEGASDQVDWTLDSRLLTGMMRTEVLPYAIGAEQYRDIFLERTDPDGERTEHLESTDIGVVTRLQRNTKPVDMTDTYVFVTRGERGWMVQLSTPTALMDDNQAVIDSIIDSLRLQTAD